MKLYLYLFILLISVGVSLSNAQSDRVRYYLQKVAQGKIDEVKRDLPDLLVDYPDDAGVQLLHAVVIEDAGKAVDIYQRIIKKYPNNEFADEAYWRVVLYFAIKGDTTRAVEELENYRKAYPNSQYLTSANDAVRTAIAVNKYTGKTSIVNLSKKKDDTKKEAEKKVEVAAKPKVEVVESPKEPEVKKEPEQKKIPIKKKGTFGLQVGIYSTEDAAKTECERFQKEFRLQAIILNKYINEDLKWAVVVGDYSTREAAEAAKNIVQAKCSCGPMIFEK